MKKKIIIPIMLVILIITSTLITTIASSLTCIPEQLVINTGTEVVGIMYYDNFYIKTNKITSNLGVGYCLEVEKAYPHGEVFQLISKTDKEIDKILSVGYPNVSASQLGVQSEDDAYFATQVVIWSVYEGYDVNAIDIEDSKVLQAVKNIYNNYKNITENVVLQNTAEYYYDNKVQRIIMNIKDTVNVMPQAPEDTEGENAPRIIPEIPKSNNGNLENAVQDIGNKALNLENESGVIDSKVKGINDTMVDSENKSQNLGNKSNEILGK